MSLIDRVAEFFKDSDQPWRWPVHALEDSPVRQLIVAARWGDSDAYSCKLHPNIRTIHLESIEHHIRFLDPEGHWYELEKILQQNQVSIKQ